MANDEKIEENYLRNLGANERAIIERIPVIFLRKIVAKIVRAKMRVQFTGWLQYLLPIGLVIVFSLIGGIAHLLNVRILVFPLLLIAALLLLIALFDLITVKYRLRFHEKRPQRNDHLDLFDLMRARRSCRSFQTRSLTDTDLDQLMESVRIHSGKPLFDKSLIRFEYISARLTVWPTVNATTAAPGSGA